MRKNIERLLKEGKLKKQKAGFTQIDALLKEAILDLREAKKISGLAKRATYLLAYMAMLKTGRALMLFEGYVPDDGAQHKTVVEMTYLILGEEFRALVDHFEIMRRKRNELTYEAGVLLSATDAQKSLADAITLVKKALSKVKSRNPQIEIDFSLDND
ncbi:MAG: hypothetical protein NTX01_01035 [Candidatus Omnitrophica bacterium]|nr:hypothetical protein [Candidatus Omnitrophota bacterium]